MIKQKPKRKKGASGRVFIGYMGGLIIGAMLNSGCIVQIRENKTGLDKKGTVVENPDKSSQKGCQNPSRREKIEIGKN